MPLYEVNETNLDSSITESRNRHSGFKREASESYGPSNKHMRQDPTYFEEQGLPTMLESMDTEPSVGSHVTSYSSGGSYSNGQVCIGPLRFSFA